MPFGRYRDLPKNWFYEQNNSSTRASPFLVHFFRELKNHDEVHDDDVCWLGKHWNENVSFGGKKETSDAVGQQVDDDDDEMQTQM